MSEPRVCDECGVESRDTDFCPGCRTYLAWNAEDAPAAPDAAADAPAPESSRVARLLVRATGDGGDAADLDALAVEVGAALVLAATVRNESGIDDAFTVDVAGLPASWVEVRPSRIYLAPAGSRGRIEGDATITIRPPRTSEARMGPWPFAIAATAAGRASGATRVDATLVINPFGALELAARPTIASGRRRGEFACEVRNLGNLAAGVQLLASDAAQACWFDLPAATVTEAGRVTRAKVIARPVRPLLVGRSVDHRLHLQASAPEVDPPPKATPLVYRQRPWIPWWAPPLIVLLAAIAAALYLASPHHVTVPALIGAPTAFVAQQELSRAGLTAHPQVVTRVLPRLAPGVVVAQVPHAGSVVAPSTPVTLQVAAGPATTIVPDLLGLTAAGAETTLSRVHLTLGAVSPALDPKARVNSQLPPAGTLRQQGASVEIVLARRTAQVPDVRGRNLAAANRTLTRVGLALGSVTPPLGPEAKVTGQLPSAGERTALGGRVNLTVAPRTVLVPNIGDMTAQAADAALQVCGLSLGALPSNLKAGEIVASQVPGAGSRQALGTSVTAILAPKPTSTAPSSKPAATAPSSAHGQTPPRKSCALH